MIDGTVWLIWFGIMLLSFGVLEWVGWKQRRTEGTLSFQVWKILFRDWPRILEGTHPRRPRSIVYFLVLTPLVWLLIHFAAGGRFG